MEIFGILYEDKPNQKRKKEVAEERIREIAFEREKENSHSYKAPFQLSIPLTGGKVAFLKFTLATFEKEVPIFPLAHKDTESVLNAAASLVFEHQVTNSIN
jgi:hypothetical protein